MPCFMYQVVLYLLFHRTGLEGCLLWQLPFSLSLKYFACMLSCCIPHHMRFVTGLGKKALASAFHATHALHVCRHVS